MTASTRQHLAVGWFAGVTLGLGAAYGFIEGASAQLLSHWGGSITWKNGTSSDALLFSPLFYAPAYFLLSLPVLLLSRLVRRARWDAILLGLLLALSGFLLASLMGHWFSTLSALLIGLGIGAAGFRWYLAGPESRRQQVPRWSVGLAAGGVIVGLLGMAGKRVVESSNYSDLPAADSLAPNVLLLIIDTGRGDHLTPYGYKRATTPQLQQLADSGTLFEWALSAAPTTLPSHASMFTGKLVKEHHAGWRGRPFLDNRFPTIAEFMQAQGYQTAGFVANVFWAGRHTGLDRGFHHYEDYYGTPFDGITRTILGRALAYWILPRLGRVDIPGRKSAELVNRELLDWLSWTPEDRPFFAMVNYLDVHAPYLPPEGFANRLSRKSTYRTTRIEIGAWREHNRMPSEAILQEWRDRYDESLMYLDHQIGNLVDSLTAHDRQRNTVIIVTADHGESFGDHGTLHHGGSLHQEQVRVPLILWGPGIVDEGARVSTPVDLRSLPATIADLTEADHIPFPGTSLLEIDDSSNAAPAVSEGPYLAGNPDEWQTGRGWVASVLKGRHHLIALESGEYDLYDVRLDPTETHDLAGAAEGKRIIGKLQEDLKRVVPDSGSGEETGDQSTQD